MSYSAVSCSQVTRKFEWTSTIALFVPAPALAKPASSPKPTSTIFAVKPPSGVGGDHPIETSRTGNGSGDRISTRVFPSTHATGTVYFSVCTSSTPDKRNACTAQPAARSAAGVPVTRPPIESLRYLRFSSRGDAPIAFCSMIGANSAQDFPTEQEPSPCGTCFDKGAGLTGGS